MNEPLSVTDQFERNRQRLRSLAYRMLGSVTEADDALQEAWLRVNRADTSAVENTAGWLTTVVSRICLDMLRARRSRREELFEGMLPEPVVRLSEEPGDPEREVLMADSVSVALLVVLERLDPAERLAFVLHDLFGLSFAEIAPIVERSVPATRKLASRARLTLRGAEPDAVQATPAQRRRVIDAFLAASREGNFDALLEVLDPDVVMRVDAGALAPSFERHGSRAVAEVVIAQGTVRAPFARPAIVNGAPGVLVARDGEVIAVAAFTIARGRITGLSVIADPEKLARVRV